MQARVQWLPTLTHGEAEYCKWLGFLAMIADHYNKLVAIPVLGGDGLAGFNEFGRLTFPLFAVALATGVSAATQGKRLQVVQRLMVWGLIATPVHVVLWWSPQLNVLFTLAAGLACYAIAREWTTSRSTQSMLAIGGWLLIGAFSEYSLPGVLMVWAGCRFAAAPTWRSWGIWCATVYTLGIINGNQWALAVVAVLALVSVSGITVPRVRGLFYWLYPGHMVALGLLAFAVRA